MNPAEIFAYLGPAMLIAALATMAIFVPTRFLSCQTTGGAARKTPFLTLFLVLLFLTLTQYPLPDPGALDCSTGGVTPILRPFASLDRFFLLWGRNAPLSAWAGDKMVQAVSMNFFLCAAIGGAWMLHTRARYPILTSAALGIAVSGLAETAQATALFGLYPCPYRTFEVDDLILNVGGVITGAITVLTLCRLRGSPPR